MPSTGTVKNPACPTRSMRPSDEWRATVTHATHPPAGSGDNPSSSNAYVIAVTEREYSEKSNGEVAIR
ncbi:hypothetical protein ACLI4Z_15145 [Natrialbaceae archaeon A-arb3/5]